MAASGPAVRLEATVRRKSEVTSAVSGSPRSSPRAACQARKVNRNVLNLRHGVARRVRGAPRRVYPADVESQAIDEQAADDLGDLHGDRGLVEVRGGAERPQAGRGLLVARQLEVRRPRFQQGLDPFADRRVQHVARARAIALRPSPRGSTCGSAVEARRPRAQPCAEQLDRTVSPREPRRRRRSCTLDAVPFEGDAGG